MLGWVLKPVQIAGIVEPTKVTEVPTAVLDPTTDAKVEKVY